MINAPEVLLRYRPGTGKLRIILPLEELTERRVVVGSHGCREEKPPVPADLFLDEESKRSALVDSVFGVKEGRRILQINEKRRRESAPNRLDPVRLRSVVLNSRGRDELPCGVRLVYSTRVVVEAETRRDGLRELDLPIAGVGEWEGRLPDSAGYQKTVLGPAIVDS